MAVKLSDAFIQINASMDGFQRKVSNELAGLGKVGQKAGKDVGDSFTKKFGAEAKSLDSSVKKGLDGAGAAGKAAGQDIGSEMSKSVNDSLGSIDFSGLISRAGMAGAAIAGAAGIGGLVSLGKEVAGEIGGMNRELGLTGDVAQQMGEEVSQLMRSGVVGSAEEAAAAVGAMKSQFQDMPTDQIDGLADNLSAFAKTFEMDVAESTQIAGQLITNGLATDVESAADMMTVSMQKVPQAMRGEIGDAISEYGTNFANLGYSGEEAFSMLVAAAEGGQYQIDKTGDAIKEFSVLAIDPAKAEVFESLGINATDAARAVAEGGEGARKTLEETAQKLLEMEDPGARAAAAVELFGAPVEDLGVDKIPAFLEGLSGTADGLGSVEGASQRLSDEMANSLQGRLDALKGTVSGLAGDAFMALWDAVQNKVIPAFESAGEWIQKNQEWLGPLAATIGGAAAAWGLWTAAVKGWQFATKIATGVQMAFNLVMNANPIMLVVTALAAVTAGLIYFFTQTETGRELWDKFTKALSDGWDWVTEKLSAGWAWIQENVFNAFGRKMDELSIWWKNTTGQLAAAWQDVQMVFSAVWEAIKTAVFDAWNWYVNQVKANWDTVTNALSAAWTWVKDTFASVWTTIKTGVFDAWNNVVDGVKSTWESITTSISDKWTWLKDQLHTVWRWVDDNVFEKIKSALTVVKDSFGTAADGIKVLWDKVRSAAAAPIRFVVDTVVNKGLIGAWNKVTGWVGLDPVDTIPLGELGSYATGTSRVPGPRSVGRDNMRFISADGRHAINLAGQEGIAHQNVVDAIGTHNWDRLNAAAVSGGTPAVLRELGNFNSGGVVGSITGLVNRHFPMMTITSTYRNTNDHHGAGRAVDFSNGTDTTPQMQAAAAWFAQNYGPGLLELIHSPSPYNIKNGRSVGDGFGFYGAGTMNGHRNHVHVAAAAPLGAPGTPPPDLGDLPAGGSFDLSGMVKGLWDKAISGIGKWDGGGLIGELPAAFAKSAASKLWDFVSEKITLFDTGGWLMPGRMATNQTGKPEPILTAGQWGTLSGLIVEMPAVTSALMDVATLIEPVARKSAEDYALGQARSALGMVGLGGVVDIATGVAQKAQGIMSDEEVRKGAEEVKRVALDPDGRYSGAEIEKKLRELGIEIDHIKSDLGGSLVGGLIGMA